MTIAFFEFQQSGETRSITFANMSKTLTAHHIEEVIPLLNDAETEANRGNYVALMLSYEAAPAFDSALQTKEPGKFPLAWAAVFPSEAETPRKTGAAFQLGPWTPLLERDEYDLAISEIHRLIAAGHTYQVNFSFPLLASFKGDSLACYHSLSRAQGGKYSAYLDLGPYKVLSLSPELFFERTVDSVRTKPMKGTIRRGRWVEEDKQLASWLANSEKDKAENVMIVDLLRNDLGKVSIPGSVKVTSLFELERYATVWQMTSTVQSTMRESTSLVDILRALFPCGSVTGAPKIRTMEIIRSLERTPRGIYTGTIGLLRPGGDCLFNVAIRTVVIDSQAENATFGVGGGVTIDSTAAREFEECLTKSRFLTVQPETFDLFESLLLEDGQFFLLERHLARLKNSAEFFDFEFEESKVATALLELAEKYLRGTWKVKLTLSMNGSVSTSVSAVEPTKVFRVGLATSAINSDNRLLFHKTTQRDFYTTQLDSRPDCDDLVFFNERNELTESSIANVVVMLNGKLVTPPVSAGLLAGTFRDQLLQDGLIEERVITVEELSIAEEIFLVNSVRKWINVEMLI